MATDEAPTTVSVQKLSLGGLAISLAFLGLVAYLGLFGQSGAGSIVFMLSLFGLLGVGWATWSLFSAPCPDCGAPYVGGVFPKENDSLQCKACEKYFHTKAGRSIVTADTAIEAQPVFAAPCPQRRIVWPKGCCVCEGAVTRSVAIDLQVEEDAPLLRDLATRAASLGTLRLVAERHYQIDVPVCASHGDGSADLTWRSAEGQLYVRFRSRRYAKAFEAANGLSYLDA